MMIAPDTPLIATQPQWRALAQDMLDALNRHSGNLSWAFYRAPAEADPDPEPVKNPHEDKSLDEMFADLDQEIADENAGRAPATPKLASVDRQLRPTPLLLLALVRLAATFGTQEAMVRLLGERGRMTLLSTSMPRIDRTIEKVLDSLKEAGFLANPHGTSPLFTTAAAAIRVTAEETVPFGALTDTVRFAIDRRRPIAVIAQVASTLLAPLRQLNLQETRLMRMDADLVATMLELNYPESGCIASRIEAAQLARLTPEDFVLAFREDDAVSAYEVLAAKCQPATSGSQSLRDFPLPAEVRAPLDRILNDLKAWSCGDIPWSEVTRGLLLEGPPGTGKTEIARLIAGEAGFAVVACSLSQWSSAGSKSGDVIKAMKASFAEAASKAPCVLFIDEIDGFGDRARNPDHNSAYTAYVVGALLECLDGYETLEGVIAVAATNHVSMVDAAVRRAGRFDAVVTLAHPSVELLPQALRWHLGAELRDENLDRLALSACGMSGAEIASTVRLAKSKARSARRAMTGHDLAETIAELRPAMSPVLQYRVAIHEAGHAIVAAASGRSKPKALMITAQGGHLEHKLDLGAHRKQDLEAALMIYAAGRAAEMVVFGDASAGAGGEVGSDLERATHVAAALEVSWGHGATTLWLGAPKDAIKLMREDPKIQRRVSLHLSRAEGRARRILEANRTLLQDLGEALNREQRLEEQALTCFLREVVVPRDLRDEMGKGPDTGPDDHDLAPMPMSA